MLGTNPLIGKLRVVDLIAFFTSKIYIYCRGGTGVVTDANQTRLVRNNDSHGYRLRLRVDHRIDKSNSPLILSSRLGLHCYVHLLAVSQQTGILGKDF